MRNFFKEFKTFITRGNILDMAVGVIVGSAFTAIVNGLSNFILKPIINWLLALIFGANSLSEVFTFLKTAYLEDGITIDLANSIYIDWGAFINAVINFLLIAFVLFTIVKFFNKLKGYTSPKFFGYSKKEYIDMRRSGLSRDQIEERAKIRDDELARKKAEEEVEKKKHTTEGLLQDIKKLLEQKQN